MESGFADPLMHRAVLSDRLDAAVRDRQVIVFDARVGFGSTTAIRDWLAGHPEWRAVWDDARVPPGDETPDQLVRRGLRLIDDLAASTPAGGRTVFVVEHFQHVADRINLLDVMSMSEHREGVTVVICTDGRLHDRPPRSPEIAVVTEADLAWDAALAADALRSRGIELATDDLERLVRLCGGSPGAIIGCGLLRRESPGTSIEAVYVAWVRGRLANRGAVPLLLAIGALAEVPVEIVPRLLASTRIERPALDELLSEHLVVERASVLGDGAVLTVDLPAECLRVLRSDAPTPAVDDVAHELAEVSPADSLRTLYWAALAGTAHARRAFARAFVNHPDPEVIVFPADLRRLVEGRADADPALAAVCLVVEVVRGGDPREAPDGDHVLRLPRREIAQRTGAEAVVILAARALVLAARDRPSEAIDEAEAAQALIERTPWEERLSAARMRNQLHATLLVAHTQRLELETARTHAAAVVGAPASDRWRRTLEDALGVALYDAVLAGDAVAARELDRLGGELVADGTPTPLTLLLGRYVDAMNAYDRPAMADLAERISRAPDAGPSWSRLGALAGKDEAFRERDPHSLSELSRDRDLVPLLRATALDLRARQLIEMGRPGLALRLLADATVDTHHVFCFPALRGRALLALGFPRAAMRELDVCDAVERHTSRTAWRSRVVRIVALSRLGMPSVAAIAFGALADEVPTRWWGGVVNWARFPEIRALAEEALLEGPTVEGVDDVLAEPLTPRELDLLALLRDELSLQQIAAQQFLSLNTVKTHVRNLYRKLGASSRAAALDRAMRSGLLDAVRYLAG